MAGPSLWDTFVNAAINSPLGGGGLARFGYKLAGHSDEEINNAIDKANAEYAAKEKAAPKHLPYSALDHFLIHHFGAKGKAVADALQTDLAPIAARMAGGIDPTYALNPGEGIVGRMAGQAAVQTPADLVRQEVNKRTGQRKEPVSLKEAVTHGAEAAAFQGVLDAGGKAIEGLANLPKTLAASDLTPADVHIAQDGLPGNQSVRPMEPTEIASIMNDPEAAGGPALQRRMNNRDVPVSPGGLFRETKRDPDGTIYLEYHPSLSKAPIPIKMGIDDGTAEIAIDQFGTGKNKLGPAEVRNAMNDLSQMYPEIKRFGGYRRSGAGAGRVQEIELPQSIPHEDLQAVDNVGNDNTPLPDIQHSELTPAEAQDMDASVPNPPSVNNASDRLENFSTNEPAPVPANDATRLDAAKNFVKNLASDERGVMRWEDEDPSNPKYPEAFYKLADALRSGVVARNKQEGMYHAELQKRVADMGTVRQASSGIEGFHAEKGTLKGALPTVQDYEGMTGLNQEDLNSLFDHIKNHPNLGWFQSINARDGLAKILQGQVPTRTEIAYLARTMPPELIRELMKNRSFFDKLGEVAVNTLNVPKALMASFDVSAPFRQGVLMVGRKEFWTALGPMFRAFASKKYAKAVKDAIYEDPLYSTMEQSGLAIPKYDETGPMEIGEHEEPFMTDYASKIPLVGLGVKASERAFNTFVYKLRADTFKTIYNAAREDGKSWTKDSTKDLSRFINTFTGRGDLGRFNNMAPALNTLFFSPRLLKSRVDSINPVFYKNLDPTVRAEALKSAASFVTIASAVMGLAAVSGAQVGLDPRKADGWKIKMGNTRYDILGGEQQLIRLMGNVATYSIDKSKEIAKTGKIHMGYKDRTAIDNIGTFLRNKESPDVSLAHDFLAGNTAIGEDFSPKKAALERGTPMSAGDALNVYDDAVKHGMPKDKALARAVVMASPGLVGVSVSTYEKENKSGGSSGGGKEFGGTSFGKEFNSKEFKGGF